MASRLANALGLALVATLIEQAVLPKIGLGSLLEKGSSGLTAASFLPTGYGLVIIIVTFTYLWVLMYGMKVGGARSKYAELAEKDGSLPPNASSDQTWPARATTPAPPAPATRHTCTQPSFKLPKRLPFRAVGVAQTQTRSRA